MLKCTVVLCSPSFEVVLCFVWDPRRVVVIWNWMICLVILIMNLGNSFIVISQMHELSNSCSSWRHIDFNQASPTYYLISTYPSVAFDYNHFTQSRALYAYIKCVYVSQGMFYDNIPFLLTGLATSVGWLVLLQLITQVCPQSSCNWLFVAFCVVNTEYRN